MDIPPSRYHTLEVYTRGDHPGFSRRGEPLRAGGLPFLRRHDGRIQRSLGGVGPASGGMGGCPLLESGDRPDTTGMDLLELARRRGVLEFREPPAENLEKLKAASLGKKKAAAGWSHAQRFRRADRAGRLSLGPDRRWKYPAFSCGRGKQRKGVFPCERKSEQK